MAPQTRERGQVIAMSQPAANHQNVAIMDTTLRDGEQTPDVSYTPAEKLQPPGFS